MGRLGTDLPRFAGPALTIVRRVLPTVLLTMFLSGAFGAPGVHGGVKSAIDTFRKLHPDEWNNTAEEVTKELFIGSFDEIYRPFVRDMVRDGQTIYGASRKIAEDKSDEAVRDLAEAAAEQMAAEIESRYPDPGHPARKLLDQIKGDPEGYTVFVETLLNGGHESPEEAIVEGAKAWGAQSFDDAVSAGTKILKDMVNSVAPGSGVLKQFDTTFVDVAISAGKKSVEVWKSAKDEQDRQVFDCFYDRYAQLRKQRNASAARAEILDTGIQGYDCPGLSADVDWRPDGGERSILGDIPDAIRDARGLGRRLTKETATLATHELDREALVDLLEGYEDGLADGSISGPQRRQGVTSWIKERTVEKRHQRAAKSKRRPLPIEGMARDVVGVALVPFEVIAEFLRTGLMVVGEVEIAVAMGLWEALNEERYKEVGGEDYLPVEEVKIFAEGIKAEDEKKKQKAKDEKDPEKVAAKVEKDLKCNPKLQQKSGGNLDSGFIAQDNYATRGKAKDPDFVDEDGCRPYGDAAKRDEKVVSKTYQYEARSREGSKPPTTATRCAALNARVDDASSQFREGRIKDAHATLGAVISDIDALPDSSGCTDVRQRAEGNQAKTGQLVGILGGIKEALTRCEPDAIDQYIQELDGASNVRLVALRNRMERARPIAATYSDAESAFRNGNLKGSERLFHQALARAQEADGGTCKDIEIKINANLTRIDTLTELSDLGTRAAEACDIKGIDTVLAKVKGETNPYFEEVSERLSAGRTKCDHALNGNPKCREVRARFEKEHSMAAFALGKDGNCGAAWGRETISDARSSALTNCRKRTTGCRIVAEHTHNKIDKTAACRKKLEAFSSLKPFKAFAMTRSRTGCGWSYGYSTRARAVEEALARCRNRGSGCHIVR
jgi:hypothetical protein